MGDVGAVAELATVLFKWATDPSGYHTLSLDAKLGVLRDAKEKAMAGKDWAAVDRLRAEYDSLSSAIL